MIQTLLSVLLLLSISLTAQTHSLIIGINNGNLIGAENDAHAMTELLREKGITISHELYGKNATKARIIKEFQEITQNTKPNDWVYLFFSGHGTSAFDPANRNNPQRQQQLKGTGALLSADNQLIIIRDTLAPLFQTLDSKGVHTVVIFDACFSGEAYKDILTTKGNLPFYTPTPTTRKTYPYQHLIYLSSTTRTDYASESAQYKRGFFSMAITHCLQYHHTRKALLGCLNTIKYKQKMLPQQPIILPKHNFSLFPPHAKFLTNYTTLPSISLKEQLFNLTKDTKKFDLYTLNQEGLPSSKNYHQGEKLSVYLRSKESGYFVLLMMGSSNQLKLSYPNTQNIPYIHANTNKQILTIEAKEPFGEELFGAFLVNKSSAMALQKLHIQTNGLLEKEVDIQEAMRIIHQGQIVGKKLVLKSYE